MKEKRHIIASLALSVSVLSTNGECNMDEKNNDNFWSWLGRQPLSEKVAEDIVVFREEDHPREKGDGKGGRFATKPETIEK